MNARRAWWLIVALISAVGIWLVCTGLFTPGPMVLR